MKEALAQVRRDLGGDAVILDTREVRRRRLFGLGTRELIEVTASRRPARAGHGAWLDPRGAGCRPAMPSGGPARAVRRAAQPAARDGRGPEPARPDRPPPARPARRAGADLCPAARGRGARGPGPPAGPARRRAARARAGPPPRAGPRRAPRGGRVVHRRSPRRSRRSPGTRRVVALVGPTGVGKTTTVAKLAANFKLAHGFRPGLVTVDTYRIAAVEQLRTYAEIIDLPLAVANAPSEMRRAIDELGDVDLVLIDTAGRSPRDEVKIRELADFLAEARPDEVHLVLSAVAGERSLRAAVERFAVVQRRPPDPDQARRGRRPRRRPRRARPGRPPRQLPDHRPGRPRRHRAGRLGRGWRG